MAISKSKASRPSKVVKPKTSKRKSTESGRNYRYTSFNERIALLKIDPVRRRRENEEREELADDRATYFGRSLARWRDVNLSHSFVSFATRVAALSDNLPLLLHNQDQILTLLVEHIEKRDALAMEPLLGLMSDFAHDLDVRFERHFQLAVRTVSAVAAKHQDPAVVEWSFNCLAWLFKYLSRLLTPDLRPLYDLMAPYLGKDSQKPYIVRFAAESMSFLIRKAAVVFERDSLPLERVIEHIFLDLNGSQSMTNIDLYQQGVMVLLTDAIKGIQQGLHSSGPAIIRTAIRTARSQRSSSSDEVVFGVLTSLIHFTMRDTFATVQDIVLEEARSSLDKPSDEHLSFAAKLLFVIISVRKGSRISNWPGVLDMVTEFTNAAQQLAACTPATRNSVSSTVAVALLYCSDPGRLARAGFMSILWRDQWTTESLRISDFVARIDHGRYDRFLLEKFRNFMMKYQYSESSINDILLLLPPLLHTQVVEVSPALQTSLVEQLQAWPVEADSQSEAFGFTILQALPNIQISSDNLSILEGRLVDMMLTHVDEKATPVTDNRLVFGVVLEHWLRLTPHTELPESLFARICEAAHSLQTLPVYWSNITKIIPRQSQQMLQLPCIDSLQHAILQALCLSDHSIRENVLDTIQAIYTKRGQEIPNVLSSAILVESTPISLDTSRTISMNIRRLASEYALVENDPLLSQAIPKYCLGLLHLRLSQAWSDAIDALGHISKTGVGEQSMMDTIQEWLHTTPTPDEPSTVTTLIEADFPTFQVVSDFECPNLARMAALSEQVFDQPHGGRPRASVQMRQALELIPATPITARSQALKVLSKLPQIAEKRSRLIVPTLLQWAGSDSQTDNELALTNRWNRKDQKEMLNVFSQFQNPRVLFRAQEVHDALLHLCLNGDVEIQTAALKALLAWKTPAIVRYEEHLIKLLDEARFREELSVFLQGGEEDSLREADLPEVMPVLLRLLYGRLVGGGKEGQQAKRKAVFVALSSFPPDVMAMFVDIVLSSTAKIRFTKEGAFEESSAITPIMPLRQQLGMLNMLGDMIETLGSALKPFASIILNTLTGCTVIASRQLQQGHTEQLSDVSLLRNVRQNGLQALYKLFSTVKDGDFSSECRVIALELLQYRLDSFVAENSQGISATLHLISAWSTSDAYLTYLLIPSNRLLVSAADLMSSTTTKGEVRLFVLTQIFDQLLAHDEYPTAFAEVTTHLTGCLAAMLNSQPDSQLLDACVRTLQKMASFITDGTQVQDILSACQSLLVQPSQIVSTRTKVGLLRTMIPLLDHFQTTENTNLYDAVCGLFSRLHDLQGRAILAEVLGKLVGSSSARQEASKVCQDLNKVNTGRLDEPDFESREQGFVHIYEHAQTWNREQWLPVLHNCLHFLRDEMDTVNRASAAKALHLLIASAADHDHLLPLVQSDLFGAIQRGMTHKSEFVRAEYLNLLNSVVLQLKDWKEVSDLQTLAFDGDDEASFFTNVLHIQQHRRLRALRRLGETSSVNTKNVVRIFLPLLEQFVFDQADGDAGRTLADQAIQTIGQLARRLKWSDLRKTLLRYYGFLKTREDFEKTVLRLIGALVDGLSFSMTKTKENEPALDADADADDDTITVLPQNRIDVITKDYLPPLQHFLHRKDDSTVDRRVAVAISVVKLARLLPDKEFTARLAPTLTDIAHILRSRDLEAREQTRKTLSTILGLIGPNYLHFLLKELRASLSRGYQLHVLSYTVHHLLVTNGPQFKPGDVDDCVPELTTIILDDIFGITGQEKDAEEYKSGMKEVKSSKSYDTMEVLARMASITHLGRLVMPVRALLQEKLDARLVKKIDDLLLRVRRGIDQNPAADSRDMLVFCHELVRQVYTHRTSAARESGLEDWKLKKYLMQSKTNHGTKGSTTSFIFKLSAFALALLRKVLRRHEDLQTPANLAGFLPMIGDGLVAGEVEVKIESAKLLSTILRVELPEIDAGIALYLREAIAMVKGSQTTINDTARAGLDLATAILRERREATIRDKDIGILLRALKADIDEPDRQGQTFRFLRAVLGRKIVIPEIYEIMEDIARIMINNPDESIRQNARAAYIQFVVDFPQGKERWAKTTAFLVKNLGYEHAGGRKSVLEVIHTLLGRVSADAVQDILLGLYLGLIPRVISDEDASCREMAAVLVRRVLEVADQEQQSKIKSLASKWLQNDKKDNIRQAAVVSWTLLLRADLVNKKELDQLLDPMAAILDPVQSAGKNQLHVSGLGLLQALCEVKPERAFAIETASIWSHALAAVASGVSERQDLAVKVLALLYNDVASTTAKTGLGLSSVGLRSSAGLNLDDQFWCRSCTVHLRCLRDTSKDQLALTAGVSKNLVFFARVYSANSMQWDRRSGAVENQENDDEQEDDELRTDDDDSDDNDNDDGIPQAATRETSALGYLVSRLAYLIRREELPAMVRTAALQTAAAIIQLIGQDVPNAKLLVRPLYVLTDPSIPQRYGEEHKALVDKAREMMDLLQSKVGAEKFIEMLGEARKAVTEKRDERRRKRRIEAVSQPERWAKEKRRRGEVKKVRSRAKSDMNRSKRRGW